MKRLGIESADPEPALGESGGVTSFAAYGDALAAC